MDSTFKLLTACGAYLSHWYEIIRIESHNSKKKQNMNLIKKEGSSCSICEEKASNWAPNHTNDPSMVKWTKKYICPNQNFKYGSFSTLS